LLDPSRPSAPCLIFDFDGTLADSMEVVIRAYDRVAPFLRVPPLDRAAIPHLRTLGPRAALSAQGIAMWKVPLLVQAVRLAMQRDIDQIAPCEGVVPALRALAGAGCRLRVLSTNARRNIAGFVARHRLDLFDDIEGGVSMFGKARALTKLLRRERLDPRTVYYVGDESRDIAAARAAGVGCIAVGWGAADPGALRALGPDHLVDTPEQLERLFVPA